MFQVDNKKMNLNTTTVGCHQPVRNYLQKMANWGWGMAMCVQIGSRTKMGFRLLIQTMLVKLTAIS